MTRQLTYAGIGPRSTPDYAQATMTAIADELYKRSWLLRSGRAVGADQAFEIGAKDQKEIFLPWEGYNGASSDGRCFAKLPVTPRQIEIAQQAHPAWDKCSDGARMLLCRNVPIILGENLDDPVKCVITWLPRAYYTGGTKHALNIASLWGIPVFDVGIPEDILALSDFILATDKQPDTIERQVA